jgi:tripartite-type tricarboxylate transporter receptor subunit TctC
MNRRDLIVGAALGALAPSAFAQADYPNKPVRIFAASTGGSPLDITARMIGDWWGKRLGQPFVAEPRPGGNGMIAVTAMLKERADGYSLLCTTQAIASSPVLVKEPPYHPLRDIAPIATIQAAGWGVGVSTRLPVKTMAELVEYARANPGKVNYGEAGITSIDYEDLLSELKLEVTRVRYKGGAPMFAALLAGEVDIGQINSELALDNPGRVRALAWSDSTRHPKLPDVPTVAESVLPGYRSRLWLGIVGQPGLPPEIVRKLNSEANEYLKTPDAIAKITAQGREPAPSDPEAIRADMEAIMKRTESLVAKGVVEVQ